MSNTTKVEQINSISKTNIFKNKTYAIVSKWGYPFGGGESFLYTTMEWATKLGMHVYWLCFTDSKNVNYTKLQVEKLEYGKVKPDPNGYIIRLPGGITSLSNWLKLLKPDFVHHQGHWRREIFDVCEKLRIEFMSGYHFWFGALILDNIKLNQNILENYQYHSTDNELVYLYNKKYCNLYTVSPFVSECISKITGYDITDNIYSSSSVSATKIKNLNVVNNKYVTMINIHYLKGGELALHLIEQCHDTPFMCIKTEHLSDELDEKIKLAIEKRNSTSAKCILMDRIENPKIIYQYTKILLVPSIVDETFCRVVNEAMMNGIPVMSTGQGNIKNLMGSSGYILPYDNFKLWEDTLNDLYHNTEELQNQSSLALKEYENYSEQKAFELFKNMCKKVVEKSKEQNVMLFCPWCDQGLGIQSRNYAHILKKYGYNVFIFAIKPYNANSCLELQKEPSEWIIEGCENNVYYSNNDRESVTDDEINTFVKMYNIGKCLIPETCWFRVFQVAKLLDKLNVKCFAIPNIEIVRYDEMYKHSYFYKILCNNNLCSDIFNSNGITKTEYIGYGINNEMVLKNIPNDNFKFLFIGGMNAFSRKHILEICESFVKACKNNSSIRLTCTIQKTNLLEIEDKQKLDTYLNHPNITFIQTHLSYSDILNLYYTHHVTIQVSKHEGLGLGFYESLATGTPVITLNTPPHNEIVLNSINGWLIPCYYKPMTDNLYSYLESAYFDTDVLAKKMCEISLDTKNYDTITKNLMIDYANRLHIEHFEKRFINALN